jgi:hypothetical protein
MLAIVADTATDTDTDADADADADGINLPSIINYHIYIYNHMYTNYISPELHMHSLVKQEASSPCSTPLVRVPTSTWSWLPAATAATADSCTPAIS